MKVFSCGCKSQVYFCYLQLYSNSELKNGDSMMLSICEVQASNKDPAVTAAETGNQRSFGNDNTPEKLEQRLEIILKLW